MFLLVSENRSPTGQRLPNSYHVVTNEEEAANVPPVRVWTWEELEDDGPNWEPPAYRCAGMTRKGERCSRVVLGGRYCRSHKG
jgi:hypothetical protein